MHMIRRFLAAVSVTCFIGAAAIDDSVAQTTQSTSSPSSQPSDWSGVYMMPREVSGFAGTTLTILKSIGDSGFHFKITSYSDSGPTSRKSQGSCIIDGDSLYIAEGGGAFDADDDTVWISMERYHRRFINGTVVLLRDDALKALERENKLYDYGILIRAGDADWLERKQPASRPSVKMLYEDPTKPWNDPFVNGPNSR